MPVSRRVYLKYPCGKVFELRVPISLIDDDGYVTSILPGEYNYFESAKKKFEINNLKVIEREVQEPKPNNTSGFISLSRKIRSVE